MKQEYKDWITNHLKKLRTTNGYGMCREISTSMVEAFPSLTLTRGHVYTDWGKRGHWWCETEDNEVVDPTAKQFQSIFSYEEYKEGMDIRHGVCPNCGKELWGKPDEPKDFCSNACAKSYADYCMKGLQHEML